MFDTDEDGTLDAKELANLITFFRERGGNVPATEAETETMQASSLRIASRLIKTFDKDGDGKLNADELMDMQDLLKGGGNSAAAKE
jgi:Ca2+-binding EF-hand superfamily protein